MPISWWMDKQHVLYPYVVLLFCNTCKYILQNGWTLKIYAVKNASNKKQTAVAWFYLYEMSRIGKSIEMESRLGFLEVGGKGTWEWLLMASGIFFGDSANVVKLDCGDGYSTCEYSKSHGIVYYKWVNFMVCELYLSTTVKTKHNNLKVATELNKLINNKKINDNCHPNSICWHIDSYTFKCIRKGLNPTRFNILLFNISFWESTM